MAIRVRLATAPHDVRLAAYNAVHAWLDDKLNHWNSMFKGTVMAQVASAQGQSMILEGVDVALDAAEKAHAALDAKKI